jgi:peroxiredoxin
MNRETHRRLVVGGLVGIIIILMAQNLLLVRKTNSLSRHIKRAEAELSEQSMLSKGDTVPPFQVVNLDGTKELVNPRRERGKTLLIAFSAHCPFCAKSVEQWNRVVDQSTGLNVRIIGICVDSLQQTTGFLARHGGRFPAYSIADDTALSRRLKLSLVPQTLMLDSTGKVLRVWGGMFDDARSREALDAL